MDLTPHWELLRAEMWSPAPDFDRMAAAAASAYLGQPVALADLPADVLDHVRHRVNLAVSRFFTNR
jgi:hypothetical protein